MNIYLTICSCIGSTILRYGVDHVRSISSGQWRLCNGNIRKWRGNENEVGSFIPQINLLASDVLRAAIRGQLGSKDPRQWCRWFRDKVFTSFWRVGLDIYYDWFEHNLFFDLKWYLSLRQKANLKTGFERSWALECSSQDGSITWIFLFGTFVGSWPESFMCTLRLASKG